MRKQEKNSAPDPKNQRKREVQDHERNIAQKDQKQKEATMGEIPYSHTIGRHGTDEEKNLNPEE